MKFKKIITISLLVLILSAFTTIKGDYFEMAKQVETFVTLYKTINSNYVDSLNPTKLMNTAISSMLEQLDPYTIFYNEQDIEQSRIKYFGGVGIGAKLSYRNKKLIVVAITKDRSADKSGLKLGDEISRIKNISLTDFGIGAIDLLKGKKGTRIDITYNRNGRVKNTQIVLDNVFNDAVPFYDILDNKIGYMLLKEFSEKAFPQVKEAFEGLKIRGAKALIIDLRGNPGGLLREAISIISMFVPKGQLVVSTKSRIKRNNRLFQTNLTPIDLNIPITILIDGHSASASEIVSGTLQDIDRAVVIGSRSFGKGLVQNIIPLAYGNQLKVTTSRYYTPSGRCIQALDYAHKDKYGRAKRNTADNYSRFITKNGRSVFDGGGIMPDVIIPSLMNNEYIKILFDHYIFFDFATKYFYEHQNVNVDDFKLSALIFEEFKTFVRQSSIDFNTDFEKSLQKKIQKKEFKDEEVIKQVRLLLRTLKEKKGFFLDKYKNDIRQLLEQEILKRYIYQEGLYKYNLTHDKVIQKAKEVLKSPRVYQKLLKP